MSSWLFLIPAFPLAGFLALTLAGSRLPRLAVSVIGAGSVGMSAAVSLAVAASFPGQPPGTAIRVVLWRWMDVAGFAPQAALYLDALSLLMVLVVTGVGFLIHVYSTGYMAGDPGFARFFAWMNLFVASMLVLVLADDLLFLYLGWEGVGLCSYLLIGFRHADPKNGRAARKAFIMTRVGDTALAIGLFILFTHFHTLDIQEIATRAARAWTPGSGPAVAVALLLLLGAVGKSAQIPLQTWLPDAMAGPTPVSALIHAATMVTAGVYLIARTHVLFSLAPAVMALTAFLGAATLLLAGGSALVQRDIKRVLAYSTMSQVGYMFLALGVGAWSAALFHFMIHAFFKALLFLAAGCVILALEGEHDLHRMGGLRRRMPATFWTFLIGAGALCAVPLATAGFYSKDWIIREAWAGPGGNFCLWAAAVAGAFLTSLYTFRMVALAFFGPPAAEVKKPPGRAMLLPLVILAVLSLTAGFLEIPHGLGNVTAFSDFLSNSLPRATEDASGNMRGFFLEIFPSLVSLAGILAAFWLVRSAPSLSARNGLKTVRKWAFSGWGFDRVYGLVFLSPILRLARVNRDDAADRPFLALARLARAGHRVLSATQTGRVRSYATGVALGAIVLIGLAVLL